QGHRRVHGRRDSELRVPRARGDPRYERRARAVPQLRGEGRSEEPRDETSSLETVRNDGAAPARLRLQPGADGLRRDDLRRAQSEMRRLPDDQELPRLSVHARQMTIVVTAAVIEIGGR